MNMNFNKVYLALAVFLNSFFMGNLDAFGQKVGFAQQFKEAVVQMQYNAAINPETFDGNVAEVEKKWGHRNDTVEQSVVDAMLGSCYKEMTWTSISDFDEETREEYGRKKNEHFERALENLDALADAKIDDFEVLVQRGADSDIYESDMLSVLLDFVLSNAGWATEKKAEMYEHAWKIYRQRGNMNGYGKMKMTWLSCMRHVYNEYGRLSSEQYKDSLYQLLQEVKDVEIGADVALAYGEQLSEQDDKVLFWKWALENVAKSRKKGNLQRELDGVLQPSVNLIRQNEQKLLADVPYVVSFNYWNCDRVKLTVRQYVGRKSEKVDGELLLTGAVVERKDVVFEVDSINAERKAKGLPVKGVAGTEFSLPAGRYVLVAECAGDKSVTEFNITSLCVITADLDKDHFRLWVVDNKTGRPVEGVKVQCRKEMPYYAEKTVGWENRNLVCELTTDANGVVDVEKHLYVRAVRDVNDYTDYVRTYDNWRTYSSKSDLQFFPVMTDRSLYRPGQTVQGTVIDYAQNGDKVWAVEGDTLSLVVTDAQKRKIATQQLVTNAYGSASFSFVLPDDCAVGNLSIRLENKKWYHIDHVRVEEYKRPTFDVTLDGAQTGLFGQTLEVEGTAMMFAGAPVQGGAVHYTIDCVAMDNDFWRYMMGVWENLSDGELTTDDEGRFRVPVTLTDKYLKSDNAMMCFRVKATVTDVAGESHEAQWFINSCRHEYMCEVVVETINLAKDATFKVNVYDANHKEVKMNGKYRILRGGVQVAEGKFIGGDDVPLPKALLQLGVKYDVIATVVDSKGNEIKDKSHFVTYSSAMPVTDFDKMGVDDKRRTDGVQGWDFIYSDVAEYKEGDAIDLYFSTEETNAYIIYNVYNVDTLLESHVAVTDGALKRLRLQYREEWGDGISVHFTYVHNGHLVSLRKTFTLAKPDKKLKLEWATFRDKLQAGQQEQWTLTVTDKQGQRVSGAEMLAVLYDASLDLILPHSWNFDVSFVRHTPSFIRIVGSDASVFPRVQLRGRLQDRKIYSRTFNTLISFEHDRFMRSARYRLTEDLNEKLESAAYAIPEVISDETMAKGIDEDAVEGSADFSSAKARENFNETAFFLPHLMSDESGNVNIQFTLPESLTEWKFMGVAHTKDMDYGTITATAVARKDFMLRPNMPRFVRWGDKATIASSVINQSEKALNGRVRMRLLDHATGEVLLIKEKPFRADVGKTTSVDFTFDVQENWQDLDCELIAASGNVNDGEKNLLPVLTTLKEVVETVPFYIIGDANGAATTKDVDLSGLYNQNSPTAKQKDLKVEYTDTPAWMCVEALRSIKTPENDNAVDFAASLYANIRLLDLMRTFPVLEKHESKADLQESVAKATEKLSALQHDDGGWCWFSGMSSSFYITLAVCDKLVKIPSPSETVKAMLTKGMAYLDKHELSAYNEMLKRGKEIRIYESTLRYLYVSAQMQGRVVSKSIQQMRDRYLTEVEKAPRDLTIYGVANAAYALRGLGHEKAADRFVKFLKEYTVEKPSQGRFYATDAAYYSWMDYRIPTQVAAMKAIRQKDENDAYLNDMQLWLIAQKQVQKWDNPLNTIDVVDLLLQISPMETFGASQKPLLKIDGKELTNIDYGTINTERDKFEGRESNLTLEGNFLADVPAEQIEAGVKTLTVEKQSAGISWGAAYATFLESIDNLHPYATDELKIQRKLYIQRAGSTEWVEYKDTSSMNIGDKLRIRHIVTADRDMDFVRISAQHPACLEPVRKLSGYQWMGGRGGYLSIHDSSFDVFFDWFTRGTSTIDMEYYVSRAGTYEMGISTVECAYAKQFGGHADGLKVSVGAK